MKYHSFRKIGDPDYLKLSARFIIVGTYLIPILTKVRVLKSQWHFWISLIMKYTIMKLTAVGPYLWESSVHLWGIAGLELTQLMEEGIKRKRTRSR